MGPISTSTTGNPLTSVRAWTPSSLKIAGLRFKLWIAYCHLAGTIQENKVGLPWMILAIKQVNGPSPWETAKKSSKPLRTKDYERYGKAYPTFLTDLYQDKAQQVTIDLPIEEDLHLNGKLSFTCDFTPAPIRPAFSPTLRAWKEIPPTLSCCLIGPYAG